MSENFKIGDLVEIVDIEESARYVISDGMRRAIGGTWLVRGTHGPGAVIVQCGKENGGSWVFSRKSLRKVNPAPAPRKINISEAQITYDPNSGVARLVVAFVVGNSSIGSRLETIAVCSKSDTFKKRTGRVIAMQRACDILGVTMREIAEKM